MRFKIETTVKKRRVNDLIDNIYKCKTFKVISCFESTTPFERNAKLDFECETTKKDLKVVYFAEQVHLFKNVILKLKPKIFEVFSKDENFKLIKNSKDKFTKKKIKYKFSYVGH